MGKAIRTRSRVRVWYLLMFRGHKVRTRLLRPVTLLGLLFFYDTTWIVTPL